MRGIAGVVPTGFILAIAIQAQLEQTQQKRAQDEETVDVEMMSGHRG